ncbi:MAG: hypothetical protein H5U00_12110, partial [Clostridia bacterium]|nr:hypothetical protein [Clostridia bacterium]
DAPEEADVILLNTCMVRGRAEDKVKQSIDDLVNHLVGRVLDLLDIPNSLSRRWGEGKFKLRTGTGSKVREQTDNSLSPGARGASMRRLVCKVREEQVEP